MLYVCDSDCDCDRVSDICYYLLFIINYESLEWCNEDLFYFEFVWIEKF